MLYENKTRRGVKISMYVRSYMHVSVCVKQRWIGGGWGGGVVLYQNNARRGVKISMYVRSYMHVSVCVKQRWRGGGWGGGGLRSQCMYVPTCT